MEGYDVEVVANDNPDMYCSICLKLMNNPVQFECSHALCDGCYGCLLEAAVVDDMEVSCPTCRKEIDPDKVFEVKMVQRMILAVVIKCKNHQFGCEWEGELGNVQNHIDIACIHQLVTCTMADCDTIVLRKDLKDHEINCYYRLEICQYCFDAYLLGEAKDHLLECESFPVDCENKCGERIPRDEMEEHLEKCELKRLPCPYAFCGCDAEVLKCDVKAHLEDSMGYHLLLATKILCEQNTVFRNTKENIESLHTRIDKVEQSLSDEITSVEENLQQGIDRIIEQTTTNRKSQEKLVDVSKKSIELMARFARNVADLEEIEKAIKSFPTFVHDTVDKIDAKALEMLNFKEYPAFKDTVESKYEELRKQISELKEAIFLTNRYMDTMTKCYLNTIEDYQKFDVDDLDEFQELVSEIRRKSNLSLRACLLLNELEVARKVVIPLVNYEKRFAHFVTELDDYSYSEYNYVWVINSDILTEKGTETCRKYLQKPETDSEQDLIVFKSNDELSVTLDLEYSFTRTGLKWISPEVRLLNPHDCDPLIPVWRPYITSASKEDTEDDYVYSVSVKFNLGDCSDSYVFENHLYVSFQISPDSHDIVSLLET